MDPLIRVFPRLTKCNFHKYGYSGSIETHDALCFLCCKYFDEFFFFSKFNLLLIKISNF